MEKVQLTVTLELGVGTREAIAQLVHAIENHGRTPAAKRNPKSHPVTADEEETSTISIAEIKKQRGKRGKKAAEPEPEEEDLEELEEVEEDEVDADDESEEAEEEDFSDDGEEEESEEEESLSEDQLSKLKAALKAHSSKHGDKKKTVAILKKFAERSDLVKPADLPKLMKLLKK